ncbi:MAG: ABC transporter substrate-binding protein [Byssovorax sp.]
MSPTRPNLPLRALFGLLCMPLLLLFLGGCSSCSGDKPAEGPPKVQLALNWVAEPEFGGFYAARESGAFKKAGFEVDIQAGGAGAPVVQRVAAGQVDYGVVGADELLSARAKGADVIPLFAVYQTSPQGIMVHASLGLNSIADTLKSGITLALEPGLPYATYLRKRYGFQNIKLVPYDGGVAHFAADVNFGQQCFITSEPIAARKLGKNPKVLLIADEGYNPYVAVLVTRKALWTEKPAQVKAMIAAVREGWRAYLDDPAPTNAVMAKLNPAMDLETFAAAAEAQKPLIETAETKQKGLGTMSRERWDLLSKQLVELDVIDRAPPLDDYLISFE